MKRFFSRPYVYWFISIFVGYLILDIIFSGFYNTIPLIIIYASTVNWLKLGVSLLLTLIIGLLVSLTAVFSYIKYKERKECRKGAALAGIGGVGGLIAGVCPLCITGIFPLLLSLFGISFSFASLPFQGIEIQILVVVILFVSLWILARDR